VQICGQKVLTLRMPPGADGVRVAKLGGPAVARRVTISACSTTFDAGSSMLL
jgi:hypothetical protein